MHMHLQMQSQAAHVLKIISGLNSAAATQSSSSPHSHSKLMCTPVCTKCLHSCITYLTYAYLYQLSLAKTDNQRNVNSKVSGNNNKKQSTKGADASVQWQVC